MFVIQGEQSAFLETGIYDNKSVCPIYLKIYEGDIFLTDRIISATVFETDREAKELMNKYCLRLANLESFYFRIIPVEGIVESNAQSKNKPTLEAIDKLEVLAARIRNPEEEISTIKALIQTKKDEQQDDNEDNESYIF